MPFEEDLPEYLRSEALGTQVLVGPRTLVQVFDPAGSPQSLALSASIAGSANIGSTASAPVFTTPGSDLQLGPDEAILIEELSFELRAADNSAKLQLSNVRITDNYSPIPLSATPTPLPYTFGAFVNDAWTIGAQLAPRSRYIRATSTFPGSFTLILTVNYILTNTDGAGAHTYQRLVKMTYRRIQGLAPLIPKVFAQTK